MPPDRLKSRKHPALEEMTVKNKNTTVEKLNNEKTKKEGIIINDWLLMNYYGH